MSTGLPIQKSMSISAEHHNIEGGDIDGTRVGITVRLADQYGNPVSDGTAINFVSEGGAVGSAAQGGCVTKEGGCSVELRSQNFRPTNGRVTVLAFVQGIENFTDLNGDGQYSCSGHTGAPGSYRPLVDACPGGGESFEDMADPFLDTNLNNQYESALGDLPFPFNGSSYKASGDGACDASTTYREGATIALADAAGAGCAPQLMAARLSDENGNPLPFNTALSVLSANKVTVAGVSPAAVPSTTNSGGTVHQFTVTPDATCAPGDFTLQTKTPTGKITEFKFTAN
ncbi:MAG: hypothetical protein V7631_289 [Massilia sp.]